MAHNCILGLRPVRLQSNAISHWLGANLESACVYTLDNWVNIISNKIEIYVNTAIWFVCLNKKNSFNNFKMLYPYWGHLVQPWNCNVGKKMIHVILIPQEVH